MSLNPGLRHITLIGFGEAGSILGEDLARLGLDIATYDILLDAPQTRGAMQAKARAVNVRTADTLAEALRGADLVISAVTATSAEDVARAAAAVLEPRQTFLDLNSVSPASKRANAQVVEATGANYVEAAIMAPVPPQRMAVPMLLGGQCASVLAVALRELGMNTTAVSVEIGVASAIKMCRSIVIKGLEALTLECLFAARYFGAEQEVLTSLERTFPHMGWGTTLPDYLVSRIAEHGRRRAAEMREVSRTLTDAGIEPLMAAATAERQQWLVDAMARAGQSYRRDEPFSWHALADALSKHR